MMADRCLSAMADYCDDIYLGTFQLHLSAIDTLRDKKFAWPSPTSL